MNTDKNAKTIIFTGTKKMADDCTRQLRQDGFPALSIHGDKKQQERDWVMHEFKSGKAPILIATDVAARGLGIYIFYILHFWFFFLSRILPKKRRYCYQYLFYFVHILNDFSLLGLWSFCICFFSSEVVVLSVPYLVFLCIRIGV